MLRQPWTETITVPAPVDKRENPDPPGSAVSQSVSPATILAFHNGPEAQEGLFTQLKTQCQLDYVLCRRLQAWMRLQPAGPSTHGLCQRLLGRPASE
jgi:hypothetical protein